MTTMPSYEEYGHHAPVFPTAVDETNADHAIAPEVRLRLYEIQQQVRLFEKRAYDLFLKGLVKGTSHLSLGQEAIAAGLRCRHARRRLDVRDLPRPCPHDRPGRSADADHGRAARSGERPDERQGRVDAPHQRRTRGDGQLRDHRRASLRRQRRRLDVAVQRDRPGRRRLLRRRHHQHRRLPRGGQLRQGLEPPDRLRLREQPVHGVHADQRRGPRHQPGGRPCQRLRARIDRRRRQRRRRRLHRRDRPRSTRRERATGHR